MEKIFPPAPRQQREYIRFPLPPMQVSVGTKRPRVESNISSAESSLSREQLEAVCMFLRHGTQPFPTSHALLDSRVAFERVRRIHAAQIPAVPAISRLDTRGDESVQSAMHLLLRCLLVVAGALAADNETTMAHPKGVSVFARAGAAALVLSSQEVKLVNAAEENSKAQAPPPHLLQTWYTRLQSMALQLDDMLEGRERAAGGSPETQRMWERMVRDQVRSIQCVADYLETFLFDAVLSIDAAEESTKSAAHPPALPRPPIEQLRALLQRMAVLLGEQMWPSHLFSAAVGDVTVSAATSVTAPISEETRQAFPFLCQLLSPGSARQREALGRGVTAVLLQTIHAVKDADTTNALGALHPAGSAVVGFGEVPQAAACSTSTNSSAVRDDVASPTFADLCERARQGEFATAGLERASAEAAAVVYRLLRRADGDATRQRELHSLWRLWKSTLGKRYADLVSGFPACKDAGASPTSPLETRRADDAERRALAEEALGLSRGTSASAADTLNEVQQISLRVLARLRAMDAEYWFAVPAYDLVSFDFTTLECWVRHESFGAKTKRAAFEALCRVLDGMVDVCVERYGPTSPFSELISNIRRHLVSVAREEGL